MLLLLKTEFIFVTNIEDPDGMPDYVVFHLFLHRSCADPEGGGKGARGPDPPLKNHKNIGFSSNTGPDPMKNHSYQSSIQCLATIGPPAIRRLNGVSLLADDGLLIVVVGSSLP